MIFVKQRGFLPGADPLVRIFWWMEREGPSKDPGPVVGPATTGVGKLTGAAVLRPTEAAVVTAATKVSTKVWVPAVLKPQEQPINEGYNFDNHNLVKDFFTPRQGAP